MKSFLQLRVSLATVLLILGAVPALGAGPDLTKWSHVAPVELSERPTKGLVEMALPPEVMAVSRQDLVDLRLATESGEPVPYVVRVDRGEAEKSVSYPPQRMFDATFVPNKQSVVTVDFGGRASRTRVDVDTPGTNFRRRVTVEASQDGEMWQVLRATAWLFRIGGYENGTYDRSEVTLPDNDFRYLRVTVFNAPDDPEQVPIRKVTAWYTKSTPPKAVEAPTQSVAVRNNPKIPGTEIEVDLGSENLPLSDVALAFEDGNFLRRVEIFGRNMRTRTIIEPVENAQPRRREVEEPWQSLGSGTIYCLPGGDGQDASTGLSLPVSGQVRYLQVWIYNGSDAPLKFSGLRVRRLQKYVAFQPGTGGAYRLYTGNYEAEPPQYDLESFAERLRAAGVAEARIGTLGPNPLFTVVVKVAPWSERYAWLLWAVLLVVGGVLAGMVVRQARRGKPVG